MLPSVFAQTTEFRGLWVDAWGNGFLNSSQVTKLVNDCKTYNFNAVVVQMRRRGDAFYMPQAPNGEPRTTAVASGFDALQELINQCHASSPRIEVHCWVPTHLIWSDAANPPANPAHVFNKHPEYLMENSSGAKFIGEGFYLDPGHPDATMWNYNLAKDVVSRYDVDGFHWDYIRYPTTDSGYNPVAIARYNAEFGVTGKPAVSDTRFSNWRRRQVTDFLRWCNADLLAIKPNLIISCSVFSSRSDAFNARFQDWAAWNNEGIIDICMPMDYTPDFNVYKTRCDDAFANQGVRRVYLGPGAYLNTKENTVTQLQYARAKPLLGTTLYSYRTPNSGTVDQPGTFSHIRDNYQPTWANVPSIPWKASPTKGLVKGTVRRTDNMGGIYNATVSLNGPTSRLVLTEPHGKFGFFETVPGNYSVSVTTIGLGNLSTNVTIAAGQIVDLDLLIPVVDTTPPLISNVAVTDLTDKEATVTWVTDEPSDSLVEYGLTTAYGTSATNVFVTLNHSVILSNLVADTTYNFRVHSTDSAGNRATSTNFTFRTNPSGIVTDIIIDNPKAAVVGTWSTGNSASDKFGADYRFKSKGSSSAYLQYTPNILKSGEYQVYAWWPQGSNRATDAPYVINHLTGQDTVIVNQQTNGGKWNLLGLYDFGAGTNGNVRLTDAFTGGTVVLADAVKFVFFIRPPASPTILGATAISSSEISLQWRDNATNELGFIVARSLSASGPFEDIGTTSANVTNYTDVDLTESTRYFYQVRATNAGGESPASNPANAQTLPGLPVIVSHPVSVNAIEGENVTLQVGVRAAAPVFQWRFNDALIPGATGSVLTLNNVSIDNDGEYYVTISNPSGTVLSDIAVVRLNFILNKVATPGGTISASPNQAGYSFNDRVTVTAVPAPGSVFIGWTDDAAGTNISTTVTMDRNRTVKAHFMPTSEIIVDDLNATYQGSWSISSAEGTNKYGGYFYYTGTASSGTTADATFVPNIIYPGIYNVFIWYPAGTNRTTNASVQISSLSGSQSLRVNQTTNGSGWRTIAQGRSFAQGTSGFVKISNNTGETNRLVIADAVRFSLVNPPLIIVQPQSESVSRGTPVTLSVLASGTALTYQWQREGTNIVGATAANLTFPATQFSDAGNYRVILNNEVGPLVSDTAVLTVNPAIMPRLAQARMQPGLRFQLDLEADPAQYAIEASTNMTTWISLTNVANTNGTVQFTDGNSTNLPHRFYRARRLP